MNTISFSKTVCIGVTAISLLLPLIPVRGEPPVEVKSARLRDIVVYPEYTAPATVISLNNTPISNQIQARIESLPVNVGDVVAKGQVLVRLDCSDYRFILSEQEARVESLNARIRFAEQRLQRTRELLEKQSISEEALDERISELAVLRADLKAGRSLLNRYNLDVERCEISSPFHALVTRRTGAVGQYAGVGTELLVIMDLDQLEISAQVSSQYSGDLDEIETIFFEHDGIRYPLQIRTVLPVIDPETRNQEVRLVFRDHAALPGSAGKLIWQVNQPHIPGDLLVNRGGKLGIFFINDSKAHFHVLDDARTGRISPVDLPLETRIITQGHYALQDSVTITVSE